MVELSLDEIIKIRKKKEKEEPRPQGVPLEDQDPELHRGLWKPQRTQGEETQPHQRRHQRARHLQSGPWRLGAEPQDFLRRNWKNGACCSATRLVGKESWDS